QKVIVWTRLVWQRVVKIGTDETVPDHRSGISEISARSLDSSVGPDFWHPLPDSRLGEQVGFPDRTLSRLRTFGGLEVVFHCRSHAQHHCLIEGLADDLQADRHLALIDPTRNRERRQAKDVDTPHKTGGGEPYVFGIALEVDGNGANLRRGDRRGRGEQTVHLLPDLPEVSLNAGAKPLRLYVICSGNQAALVEQRQHVSSDIGAARLRVAFQDRRGLGQQDHPADGVQGYDVGYAHGYDRCAQAFGAIERGADGRFDIAVELLQVKILGHADAHSADGAFGLGHELRHRLPGAGWIARIVSSQGLQRDGAIAHGARQRS